MGIDSGFDTLFYLSAVTSLPVVQRILYGFKVNEAGTLNVFEMARKKKFPEL